jgi:acetyl-CoA C-acetyltransferase
MSIAPHVLPDSRNGARLGDWSLIGSMVNDGLWDIFNGYHMGVTAENAVGQYGISREEKDGFAAGSQQKAEAAQQGGRFAAEIVPIEIPQPAGQTLVFAEEEFPRHGSTAEALAKLKPAFRSDGSVTAGNASGINDGAAAVVVSTAGTAACLGLKSLARIAAFGSAGVEPAIMGTESIHATKNCLQHAGWMIGDQELIEANEAFAAQAIVVNRDLVWDRRAGQCQWRRVCLRASDWRLWRAHSGDPVA